jgi:glycosyltransferase involved in cell wall biosynthesis
MNICFIEPGYPGSKSGGGAGTYVQLVARALAKRGHKAFVISTYSQYDSQEYLDEGVVIKRVKAGNLHWYFSKIFLIGPLISGSIHIVENSLAIYKTLIKLKKENSLDIIESCESANLLYLFTGIPYIIHLHGSKYTFKKYCGEKIFLQDKIQRWLEGFLIKKAKHITSPSLFLKNEVIKEFRINPSNVSVVPYPVKIYPKNTKEENKNKSDERVVIYAGRLEKRKGVHILVKAIPEVIKRCPTVKFMFFGSDSKELTKEMLKNMFKKKGLAKKVEISSFVSRNLLNQYRQKADVCVVPSLWDNSPYVVYEAMAQGKAVIVANSGGMAEMIVNGVSGILVEPNDSFGLAWAIVKLLKNDKTRQDMAISGRKSVGRKCNPENNICQRLRLYEQAVSSFKGKKYN